MPPIAEPPPVTEPAILAANERRDTPVIEKRLDPPATPKARDVQPVVVPPPPQKLASKPFLGSLQIDSTPRGANVFIDRKAVGVTPLVVTDLVAGSHVVRLEADGHMAWSSAVRVVANQQTDVNTVLAQSIERASVHP